VLSQHRGVRRRESLCVGLPVRAARNAFTTLAGILDGLNSCEPGTWRLYLTRNSALEACAACQQDREPICLPLPEETVAEETK
jgi:hypothetical protein